MGLGFSQPTFASGVWFDDAFLTLAEQSKDPARLFSMQEKASLAERQADRIRQRVSDTERAKQSARVRQSESDAAQEREKLLRDRAELSERTKRETLKREFDASRMAALTDPRNAPLLLVPLLPFSTWKPSSAPTTTMSTTMSNASSSSSVPVPVPAVQVIGGETAATATTTVPASEKETVADPALLAEVATLRARVAEIDALRARVEHMSVTEQGRALARTAARETELQLASLASSWRAAASAAQINEEKLAALEKTVSGAEAAVAAASSWRARADSRCVDVRRELLAQLQTGNDSDSIARLVRKYGDCAREQ